MGEAHEDRRNLLVILAVDALLDGQRTLERQPRLGDVREVDAELAEIDED